MDTVDKARTYGVKLVRGPFVRLEPHPLACESEVELRDVVAQLSRPLAVDLFCGAGGLSLGLDEAGFDVILGVDHDDDALETHRAHHPGLSVNWDMSEDDVVQRVASIVKDCEVTVLAGGPPCQPFSRAGRSMMRQLVRIGRRPAHDRRRDLWESFLGVVELARPPVVLMENVPDMALDRGMVILRAMTERLEGWGYSVDARVIDTARYGVPQFRHRLLLVAMQAAGEPIHFSWPQQSRERTTVDNAIGDLPSVEGGWRPDNGDGPDPVASGWTPYAGPVTTFQAEARRTVPVEQRDRLYDHITRPVREDDVRAFEQMDHTTRYSDLPDDVKRYRDDIFDDKYKRLNPDDVSRTITAHIAKDGYWYIHPYQARTLTVREAARLQTFPDRVRFAGPPSAAFRQIGNAVPPLVGRRVGEAVLTSLRDGVPSRLRTRDVAGTLADWFCAEAKDDRLRLPWLRSPNRWIALQSQLVGERVADEFIRPVWSAVRRLDEPSRTLQGPTQDVLWNMMTALGREHRFDGLMAAATAGWEQPHLLADSATAAEMRDLPGVTEAMADLACRIVPGDTEDPVLVTNGVLRVAARYTGELVDRQNKLSDGRLAVAKMIGGEDNSHEAHLALIELASDICGSEPKCAHCPLATSCAWAASHAVQQAFDLSA